MKTALTSLLLAMSFAAVADINEDLTQCARLNKDSERLNCYDQLVANRLPPDKPVFPEPQALQEPATPAVSPISAPAVSNASVKAPTAVSLPSPEEAFGRTEAEINQLEKLEAHLLGSFHGWKKGDVLELDNGQRWKVMSNGIGYVKLQDPAVEITRGAFGSFNMRIDGMKSMAKVRRVD